MSPSASSPILVAMSERTERKSAGGRLEMKATADGLEGVFSGYGALFGVLCPTSSWSLPFDWQDEFKAGAFASSLERRQKNGGLFPACWQHDLDIPVGAYPLVREDKSGLYCEGQLALKTAKGAEIFELMKVGAVSGLSVQYKPLRFELDQAKKVRSLIECDLYEIAPCTVPNMDGARVADVKAMNDTQHTQAAAQLGALSSLCEDCDACDCRDEMMSGLKTCLDTMGGEGKRARSDTEAKRIIEAVLRDAGRSRAEAKAAVAAMFKDALRDAAADDVVAGLKRFAASIHS